MKPIVLVGLMLHFTAGVTFLLEGCKEEPVVSAVTPLPSQPVTISFPLDIGDAWFYSYSSAVNGKGSVVRRITDTTSRGFRRVLVTTRVGDSISVATEYWLYRDGKMYFRTNADSIGMYDYPSFVASLKGDSSHSDPIVYDVVKWQLTSTDFAGTVYASQILQRDAGMHPISFETITGTAQSIGLYYLFEYRFEGVRTVKSDTSRLIGLFANGGRYGDTLAVTTGVRSNGRAATVTRVRDSHDERHRR